MREEFTPGPWIARPDPGGHDGEWLILARAGDDFRGVAFGLEERDALLGAAAPCLHSVADSAPILSKYHGERGFELERFIADYEAWNATRRAALAKCVAPASHCPPQADAKEDK